MILADKLRWSYSSLVLVADEAGVLISPGLMAHKHAKGVGEWGRECLKWKQTIIKTNGRVPAI